MTSTATRADAQRTQRSAQRFRLHRAGVLNVWQYDEQVFTFADGRLLLRGANGAGKSKTLEMLLPFALDGDKARITASAKHHTSLLWLMTDGLDSGNRVGYVWVEFVRESDEGREEAFTCGVGIRASVSARSATAWHFTTSRRVGTDLSLEDEGGPLSRPRLTEALGAEGHVFERAADYKAHVGRELFGLEKHQYDEVLRLLYWLRQPQVGEDIEPTKLATQLSQALPQLDEQAISSAGETFDELTAVGEQIDRRARAAEGLQSLADAYAEYARAVVAERAGTVAEALSRERRLGAAVTKADAQVREVEERLSTSEGEQSVAESGRSNDDARLTALRESPEFRDQRRLDELTGTARSADKQAEAARARRDRQARTVIGHADVETKRAQAAERGLSNLATGLLELEPQHRADVPGGSLPLPGALDRVVLERLDQLEQLGEAIDEVSVTLGRASEACSVRVAAVDVVRQALDEADRLADARTQAQRSADEAESRWEGAREHRSKAETSTTQAEEELAGALATWVALQPAIAPKVPDELDDDLVAGLVPFAEAAAAPHLAAAHGQRAAAMHRRDVAESDIERLERERAAIEAERDPAPPPRVLPHTDRPDGHGLWQLVDFADDVDEGERACIEAALQDAGLLDAWLRPGGMLLDAEHVDIVLHGEALDDATTLADVLRPDLPDDGDVETADVTAVLRSISLGEHNSSAWIARDGTWRLGPARGRSEKVRAQYIGATARATERARRLALVDEQLTARRAELTAAEHDVSTADESLRNLHRWVQSVPVGGPLLRARAVLTERIGAEERAEHDNRTAQDVAYAARGAAAEARRAVERLSIEQQVPAVRGELDALEQRLRQSTLTMADLGRGLPAIRDRLIEWSDAVAVHADARAALATEEEAARAATEDADTLRARVDELTATVGAGVAELQRRLVAVQASRDEHDRAARAAMSRANTIRTDLGEARSRAINARERLAEHVQARSGVLAELTSVLDVPGMLNAAEVPEEDASALHRLVGMSVDHPVPRTAMSVVTGLAQLSREQPEHAQTRVWRSHNDATSGPAADHQPSVAQFGPLLAITARDGGGEAAVVALAARVAASVAADRELLTERERTQFEQHVLGELGDAIRSRRRDAEELVTAMNEQLGHVTTSQGIAVTLRWDLREDVPAEARSAVGLLTQPVGALLPEERAELRDALHRLIEASRVERPELSYGEHLASALDYRTWSQFTIRYTRPERPGQWERLHRRSALSQGEQKVLCYLPLFAAAAAHFTSLAGAAPFAPRLVLLDDAFPKIDERTHPLLFGLLVQLDLDFVITSERLWGDHSSLPSLAIYEALRDPGQRGIAQYAYRWDGRVLQGLG
ncbi:TIGR02680 family protein [Janibacter cremeus]|uniref:TIGR02680 family protein n=1 Tax=Janibacter cremeus TaxID=1285192 RepID=UPI0023F78647|nr:TIGR02680 family protein [Janibacter cremeus]WEV78754.1 TIGR02680 family protein [Janibacter cremeus]